MTRAFVITLAIIGIAAVIRGMLRLAVARGAKREGRPFRLFSGLSFWSFVWGVILLLLLAAVIG